MSGWYWVVWIVALLVIVGVVMVWWLPPELGNEFGRFEPEVPAGAISFPITLTADFSYIDKSGNRWTAPSGMETDGASIPPYLWPVIGHPFGDNYIRAAIVHDAYCDEKHFKGQKPHPEVHRMFYTACLCAGVDPDKAKTLYAAVHYFGPKWDWPYVKPAPPDPNNLELPDVTWTVDERVSNELLKTKEWKLKAPPSFKNLEFSKLEVRTDLETGKLKYDLLPMTQDGHVIMMAPESPESVQASVEAAQVELMQRCKEWIGKSDPSLDQIETWDFQPPQ